MAMNNKILQIGFTQTLRAFLNLTRGHLLLFLYSD